MQTLKRLVAVYEALARAVPPEQSRTAALIRSGDAARALARLRAEIVELQAALAGGHTHADDKAAAARRLLAARGLDASGTDVLLEAHQVSYWWLVAELAQGRRPDASSMHAALAAGAACVVAAGGAGGTRGGNAGALAAAAADTPAVDTVYRLIGWALGARDLPLDLFAELDLAEMASRPYLQEALRGA
jgi:hypothetical protein